MSMSKSAMPEMPRKAFRCEACSTIGFTGETVLENAAEAASVLPLRDGWIDTAAKELDPASGMSTTESRR